MCAARLSALFTLFPTNENVRFPWKLLRLLSRSQAIAVGLGEIFTASTITNDWLNDVEKKLGDAKREMRLLTWRTNKANYCLNQSRGRGSVRFHHAFGEWR